jgi:hypothetical protein
MYIKDLETVNGLARASDLLRAERDRLVETLSLTPEAFLSVSVVSTSPVGNVPVTVHAPNRLQEYVQAGLPGTADAFGSEAWAEFRDEILAVCRRFLETQSDAVAGRLLELGVVPEGATDGVPAGRPLADQRSARADQRPAGPAPAPDAQTGPVGAGGADSRHGGGT